MNIDDIKLEHPIRVHYFGGPFDGGSGIYCAKKLGLQQFSGFSVAKLTPVFIHRYECNCWGGDDAEAFHTAVKRRPGASS